MNIRPSAAIRQNYNEIADLCRTSQEPVYLTRNGEGDLVVMDMETFSRREKMLDLREQLLSVDHLSEEDFKAYFSFLIMIWRLLINTVERSIN